MEDLIRRQDAIEAIRKIEEVYFNNLPTLIDKASVQIELMMLPSAQPEPKKGKWLQNKDDSAGCGFFICSECRRDFYDTWNYCPNCGADMRGEKE